MHRNRDSAASAGHGAVEALREQCYVRSSPNTGDDMSDVQASRPLREDNPNYHARQAAYLRTLAANVTTARLKNRLLDEAKQHDHFAATGASSRPDGML